MDSIAVAVQCDKLPKVELLDLSDNVLKDILSTLIPLNVHPGYKSLKRLNVSNCKLSTSDIKSVMTAFRFGKLPNLRTFQNFPQRVSHEWLSDFLITDHPACRVAVSLDLQKKGLHEADIKVISDAAKQGRFIHVKEIILSGNSLTGCLGDFFGSSDCPGFPSLEILQLENTKLSKDDLTDIFEALRGWQITKPAQSQSVASEFDGLFGWSLDCCSSSYIPGKRKYNT